MPYPYSGQLNANEVYSDLFNVILRHVVFSDNIYDTKASLLEMSKVDGGLYGDTALYTSFDLGGTYEWMGDAEAANLLDVNRNTTEVTQAITLDQFRQINITLDNYLSKRAWSDESAFAQFNSALLQSINDTKRVHDSTMFNTFIGTDETTIGKQEVEISVPAAPSGDLTQTESYNRLVAQTIAQKVSDLFVDLEDVTRDYNDYGYIRSVNSGDLIAVWNSAWVNKINKLDVPMIFNGLEIDKKGEYTLPARYFGKINAAGGTGDGTSIRYLKETTVAGKVYNAGDLVPSGTAYGANETYTEDATIAFKIMHKKSVPFMSGFSTATEFWNPRALLSNHYITWGYNTLEHLKQYPFITVRVVES